MAAYPVLNLGDSIFLQLATMGDPQEEVQLQSIPKAQTEYSSFWVGKAQVLLLHHYHVFSENEIYLGQFVAAMLKHYSTF